MLHFHSAASERKKKKSCNEKKKRSNFQLYLLLRSVVPLRFASHILYIWTSTRVRTASVVISALRLLEKLEAKTTLYRVDTPAYCLRELQRDGFPHVVVSRSAVKTLLRCLTGSESVGLISLPFSLIRPFLPPKFNRPSFLAQIYVFIFCLLTPQKSLEHQRWSGSQPSSLGWSVPSRSATVA